MATYAIGDIQGCYPQLKSLLSKINFNTDRDSLWFTGDLIIVDLIPSKRYALSILYATISLWSWATTIYIYSPRLITTNTPAKKTH